MQKKRGVGVSVLIPFEKKKIFFLFYLETAFFCMGKNAGIFCTFQKKKFFVFFLLCQLCCSLNGIVLYLFLVVKKKW